MTDLPSKLPPDWLTQIKEAVKGGKTRLVIGTILGSSVISALVTSGLDYWLLEPRRLQLTSQQRLKDDQIDAHKRLAEQLNVFNKALDDAVLTSKIALQQPQEKELVSYARQNLFSLSQPMRAVELANNQKIDKEISTKLKETVDRVGKALEKAKKTPNAFREVIDQYDKTIKTELENHLTSIEQRTAQIAKG